MTLREFLVAAAVLRFLGWCFSRLPAHPRRVVFATARGHVLDGNLLYLRRAFERLRPDLRIVTIAEPYGYGLRHKILYALRLVRGMYHVRTAGLVVVDNAYLPIHVAPHASRTVVVQVWHAVGALKRFGRDTTGGLAEPERTFLHRHYDYVVTAGEASREPWSRAFGTPLERVVALGAPRTDFFFDADARAAARTRILAAYPALAGRRVILYAPTFRGRGRGKRGAAGFDAESLRAALGPRDVLVLKTHPNLDPAVVPRGGFDVVVDPALEINELLEVTDVLVTDYSSSIFEYALLRRPLVVLAPDLEEYERDPGLYLDYRTELVGVVVMDMHGLAGALRSPDAAPAIAGTDAFVARHLGASDGGASARFVERFAPR